jgi:hypothetical protein
MVRYYDRQFVPVSATLSPFSVTFGTKLAPLGQDVFAVQELTDEKIVLEFASDGRNHVYYRKN